MLVKRSRHCNYLPGEIAPSTGTGAWGLGVGGGSFSLPLLTANGASKISTFNVAKLRWQSRKATRTHF